MDKKQRVSTCNDPADTHSYGKLILFGEHFVVYKVPAIVAAVSAYTDCEFSFTEQPGCELVDNRPAVPNYKVEKADEGAEAVSIVLKHFDIDVAKRGGACGVRWRPHVRLRHWGLRRAVRFPLARDREG